MRILVAGAYGFIGAHIAARLAADGHTIRGAGRDVAWARKRFPNWEWVDANFSRPVDWAEHLKDVDAVVNCVGALQDGGRDSTQAAHVSGADALFAACEKAGVRRVVHLSAIGVDADTAYARTKLAGEAALQARDLDWSILRPSLVIARGVYGGTALIRGLAGFLCFVPLARSRARFRPVAMADVCEAVARLLKPDAPTKVVLDVAGPQEANLEEVVMAHRRWLGFGEAPVWTVPQALTRMAFALGDALGAIGIRHSFRSTSYAQMEHNVGGDPEHLQRHLGFAAQPYEKALNAEPSGVQDRWSARLYFVRPLAMLALAAFWIGTGIVCLTTGRAEAISLAEQAGLGPLSPAAADWGGAFDIAIGAALLLARRTRLVLAAMAGVTIGYVASLSFLLPWLWADPLGRLMKLIPFFALLALLAATADER